MAKGKKHTHTKDKLKEATKKSGNGYLGSGGNRLCYESQVS